MPKNIKTEKEATKINEALKEQSMKRTVIIDGQEIIVKGSHSKNDFEAIAKTLLSGKVYELREGATDNMAYNFIRRFRSMEGLKTINYGKLKANNHFVLYLP